MEDQKNIQRIIHMIKIYFTRMKKNIYDKNVSYWIQIFFDWMKIYFDIMKKEGDIMKIYFIKYKVILIE